MFLGAFHEGKKTGSEDANNDLFINQHPNESSLDKVAEYNLCHLCSHISFIPNCKQ
jgi:hypothetical protein